MTSLQNIIKESEKKQLVGILHSACLAYMIAIRDKIEIKLDEGKGFWFNFVWNGERYVAAYNFEEKIIGVYKTRGIGDFDLTSDYKKHMHCHLTGLHVEMIRIVLWYLYLQNHDNGIFKEYFSKEQGKWHTVAQQWEQAFIAEGQPQELLHTFTGVLILGIMAQTITSKPSVGIGQTVYHFQTVIDNKKYITEYEESESLRRIERIEGIMERHGNFGAMHRGIAGKVFCL